MSSFGPIRSVEAAGELEHSLEMQKVYRHMVPWIDPLVVTVKRLGRDPHLGWCPSYKNIGKTIGKWKFHGNYS